MEGVCVWREEGCIWRVCVYVCVCVCVCACVCTLFSPNSFHSTSSPITSVLLPMQDVRPFIVATAMIRAALKITSSRLILDPITYTRAAVATIGIQHTTYGYFYHALQVRISVAMVVSKLHVVRMVIVNMYYIHQHTLSLSLSLSN